MFINNAFAQAAGTASANSSLGMIVQLLLIFIVFYFILIRPQQKKIKQHEQMLLAIKVGDKIITGGGVIGVVEKVSGDKLDVKIAENTIVTVYRATVRSLAEDSDTLPQQKEQTKKQNKKSK